MTGGAQAKAAAKSTGLVLMVLASAQFLMTLDSSVMNVSIASVAKDLNTTVTGIQTAITLYTLVMASLMITGGKIGAIIGRRKAFAIGLVIYSVGSLTTALAPTLGVLIIGWSLLEGIGAALIMPAIVALVAGNFPPERRTAAYGTIAAAAAIAVAAGPLIGGAVTTLWSWRWVFAGEVVICMIILILLRRINDAPPTEKPHIDIPGVLLSIAGLSMFVFGVLRSSEWGLIKPKPGAPEMFGVSAAACLMIAGLFVVWVFFRWEAHVERQGREPLLRPEILRNNQLSGGLALFFFQYLVQAGTFFAVPLFLSVALGLSALETGVRLVPLSVALVITAVVIPKFRANAPPRRLVRVGLLAMLLGAVSFGLALDVGADASITTIPMILIGIGAGCLASQLGAVTVSSLPDSRSAEVGGLQYTSTNLGASIGTALVGSVLIAALTASFISGIQSNPQIPQSVKGQASTELSAGVPFISDAQLSTALKDAGVPESTANEIVQENEQARIKGLQAAMLVIAMCCVIALFFSGPIPRTPVGSKEPSDGTAEAAAATDG